MRLFDTAARKVVPFEPGPVVKMYVCGITPYDSTHLGHEATYLAYDLLIRRLEELGHEVRMVRNVTDVDDSILPKARELGVPYLDLAAAEIERFAGDPRFVQVMVRGDTESEWGDRKYWPIYQACEASDFVAMCHVGGTPGNRYRGSGAPSYYLEQHVWLHMPVERLAMSLICEGVFDQYPRLRVALVEACLTWAGPLQWAMDAAYEVAGADAPRLRKLPSEYFREHFWLSTQPIEEPDNPRHLAQSIEFAQMTDRVMFSSDYPHWDFDSPVKALPAAMPAAMRSKIMGENATRLYAKRL